MTTEDPTQSRAGPPAPRLNPVLARLEVLAGEWECRHGCPRVGLSGGRLVGIHKILHGLPRKRERREAASSCPRKRASKKFEDDGRTIRGRWETSGDGSSWECDFDLTYTKLR